MKNPPPIPRRKKRIAPFIILGGVILFVVIISCAPLVFRLLTDNRFTEPMDKKFGGQNLKSAVAMLELHKIRFGQYPDSLRDIKYTGDWDEIWIQGTSYFPSDDRKSYYVEVHRGWVGKPTLDMPDEFWQNTGYNEKLKPEK